MTSGGPADNEGDPPPTPPEPMTPASSRTTETSYTLNQPGRLLAVLETCMAARLRPQRSGWSAAHHLGLDLERHFGVSAPPAAIDRALRTLARRRRLRLKVDEAGILWYSLIDY